MSCENNEDILFTDDFSFNETSDVNKLGSNYVEIISKQGNKFSKYCFLRNQLLDILNQDSVVNYTTLWGNGSLDERFKPVFKNPYLGNYFTQESLYFLSAPTFKTFQSVDCDDIEIGTYFGVSTIHGTENTVCRLIPLIEINKEEADIIAEEQKVIANFSDVIKYYKRVYVKTDNYKLNETRGSYIGPLARGEGLGYFYVNNKNSVFDTSLPSLEIFFINENNFIDYEIKPNSQKIIFKLKLGEKIFEIKSDVETDIIEGKNTLIYAHTIDGENFAFDEPNFIEGYDTPYNAFGRIQTLRLQLLSLLLYTNVDKITADFDYIFYGINIKTLLETYIKIVIEYEENFSGIFKALFLNDNLKSIFERLTQKYDIYKLMLITEMGGDISKINLIEELKYKINPLDIGEFIDTDGRTFLMYILGDYLDSGSYKDKVMNFINDFVDKCKGSLNSVDKNDNSVLKQGIKIFMKWGDIDILELLINKGAILNIHKMSLLHYAVYNQLYDVVKLLLNKGMDVNIMSEVFIKQDNCYKLLTALEMNSYVVPSDFNVEEENNLQISRLLLSKGSNMLREMEDIECLNENEGQDEQVEEFEEEKEQEEKDESDFHRNLLSDFKDEELETGETNIRDMFIEEKMNIIKEADNYQQILDVIDNLVSNNININIKNSDGNNIGNLIFMNDNLDDEDKKIIFYHLSLYYDQYDVNNIDSNSNIVLQYAVYEHKDSLVNELLAIGANLKHISNKGIFKDLELKDIARLKPDGEETIEIIEFYENK